MQRAADFQSVDYRQPMGMQCNAYTRYNSTTYKGIQMVIKPGVAHRTLFCSKPKSQMELCTHCTNARPIGTTAQAHTHIHLFGQVLVKLLPPYSLLLGVSTLPLLRNRSKCQRSPTWEKPSLWHLTGQRQCHARPEAFTPDGNTMACSLPADAGRYR